MFSWKLCRNLKFLCFLSHLLSIIFPVSLCESSAAQSCPPGHWPRRRWQSVAKWSSGRNRAKHRVQKVSPDSHKPGETIKNNKMYHNELALHTLTVSLFAASEYLVFLFFFIVEVEIEVSAHSRTDGIFVIQG